MRLASPVLVGIVTMIIACDGRAPNEPDLALAAEFARVNTPSSFSATASSPTEIDLSWPKGGGQVDAYQVFRSTTGQSGTFSLLASVGANVATYADVSLSSSTQYCYELRSSRGIGKSTVYSDFSPTACATTPAPPPPPVAAPSGVRAVPIHDDYNVDSYGSWVLVSWLDNSSDEDGFRVEIATSASGPWSPMSAYSTYSANTTAASGYVVRETNECFRVTAFNGRGSSNPSAPSCTTPPANVTNLAATPRADQHGIGLSWSDNSKVEDGYRVSRRDAGVWTDIAMLPPNTTSYVDQTAVVDVAYSYRVLALKDGGSSDDSNIAFSIVASQPPAPATGFLASFESDGEGGWVYFGVYWTDNSTNEQGFRVESSADGLSGWTSVAITDPNAVSYYQRLDIFSAAGAGGCYRVVAFNPLGDSAPSNVSCSEWGTPATNVSAVAVDDHSIDLTWTDNARYEKSYLVLRSTQQFDVYDVVAEVPANTTSYHDGGLASGTSYWYLIVNTYDYAPSDYSNYSDYATATTSPTPPSAMNARTSLKRGTTAIRVRGLVTKKHPPIARRIHP